jgi:putative oxidoreductase
MIASPAMADAAKLIGRLMLAAMFILGGWGKIGGYEGTLKYMASGGVPGFVLPLVIALELGGGLLIAIGWQTRLVALALAGFTLLASLLFHWKPGDAVQYLFFMKNLAVAGGFLVLFASGAGRYSLDGRRGG